MRCLIVDVEQMGLDLALRCAAAGHEVKLYRHMPKRPERYGEGFPEIKLVDSWQAEMPWAKDGLVVNTGNFTLLYTLDRYRELGYSIFAPSLASARLETDRAYGMEVMKAAGIDVPPYEIFGSMRDAVKHAKKTGETYVFKNLDGAADDKAMTFVAHDNEELCEWLDRKIKAGVSVDSCMLQEKIDADFEIGINGWFGPNGFLPDKFQISFEHKPLMSGDIGPNTGEQISVSQYVEDDKLVDELLMPLVPTLTALDHRGDFCIGAMIDKKGKAYPLEATARMGYPALFGQMESHRGDPVAWMKGLLQGEDKLRVSYDVCTAVVLAQPRYPYNCSPPDLVVGNPIRVSDDVEPHLHYCGVMKAKDGGLETTAELVMVATALGKTISKSRDKVYEVVDNVKFPNAMWRDDAGEKVEKALPAMHRAGYALELKS
jgi:phosphoribosylamine--glycine ligase